MAEVRIHDEAREELDDAHCWYWQRDQHAADRLLSEFPIALERIAGDPQSFQEYDNDHRYVQLRTFPFLIVFRSNGDAVDVLAVAHARRRPGYWRDR